MTAEDEERAKKMEQLVQLAQELGLSVSNLIPKTQVQAQVPITLKNRLKEKATRLHISESEAIRKALELWVEQPFEMSTLHIASSRG